MEVQTNVTLCDLESLDFWVALAHRVEFFKQSVDELARLGLDIGFDAEHREGLLEVLLAEDVRELRVHLHVEEHFLAYHHRRKRLFLRHVLV